MFGDRYFLERCLRAIFLVFFAGFIIFSFFGIPFERRGQYYSRAEQNCKVQLSRDPEYRELIQVRGFEHLLNRYTSLRMIRRVAREACRHDASLKVVHTWRECPEDSVVTSQKRKVECP